MQNITPFTWISEISKNKKITKNDILNNEYLYDNFKKTFNRFLTIKTLSYNYNMIDIINELNSYNFRLMNDLDFYDFLFKVILPSSKFYKTIKSDKEEINFKFDISKFDEIYPYIDIEKNSDVIEIFEDDIKSEIEKIYGGITS